jgi:hypothetical protein
MLYVFVSIEKQETMCKSSKNKDNNFGSNKNFCTFALSKMAS